MKTDPPGLNLLLAEQERSMTLSDSLKQADAGHAAVHLAVGPEGGWTTDEVALFGSEGWQAVSLGPRILRAETAGIAAMAVVAAFLG